MQPALAPQLVMAQVALQVYPSPVYPLLQLQAPPLAVSLQLALAPQFVLAQVG